MKSFVIYRDPGDHVQVIKLGWSWPGFFFTGIWALLKGLWDPVARVFAAGLVCALVAWFTALAGGAAAVGLVMADVVTLFVAVWLGLEGNNLVRERLEKKGFSKVRTVTATSRAEALSKAPLVQAD